jgi:hypothetical protein
VDDRLSWPGAESQSVPPERSICHGQRILPSRSNVVPEARESRDAFEDIERKRFILACHNAGIEIDEITAAGALLEAGCADFTRIWL